MRANMWVYEYACNIFDIIKKSNLSNLSQLTRENKSKENYYINIFHENWKSVTSLLTMQQKACKLLA